MQNNHLIRTQKWRYYDYWFVIVVEGKVTEVEYFNHIQSIVRKRNIKIETKPPSAGNDAGHIFKFAKEQVNKFSLGAKDEFWVVLDLDANVKDGHKIDLEALFEWAEDNQRYGVAFTNPKIEHWLEKHFDSKTVFMDKKNIKTELFTKDSIQKAINYFSEKNLSNRDLLEQKGSTMHKLVHSIFEKENP